jgi:hypothetical protein
VRRPAAGQAIDAVDPEVLATRLQEIASSRWWFRPFAFVGVAMLGLAGAAITILRNWRLILLAALPALWLGAISWQWRRVVIAGDDLPEVHGAAAAAAAAVVVVMTAGSYWCNVTFALTVRDAGPPQIRRAFERARERSRWIWVAAAVTATAHVLVVVWMVRAGASWFVLGLSAVALVQMYAFVAVPVLIATGRRERRTMPARLRSTAASLGVSGITATPGLALNRLGVLLLGLGWFRWFGVLLICVAALLQVAGISSATAVKFAARLAEIEDVAPAGRG